MHLASMPDFLGGPMTWVYALKGGSLFGKKRFTKSLFYNVKFLKFYGTMGSIVIKSMYQKQ